MKPEIVVLKAFYEPANTTLERDFVLHKAFAAADPLAFIRQNCANTRAAISTTTTAVNRGHFEALPKLELLACYGPYITLIDLAAAKDHKVTVTHTPDSTAEPVADLAMGMIVAVMRRICEADRFVRSGQWPQRIFPSGTEVRGKTCGIVGMGRIGREIAQRAASFGMSICYFGPHRKNDVAYRYFDNLEHLARAADCLVVTCALTPATRNLVDARVIDALGVDGFLVNVARGAIVDEPALVAALASKKIAGAALDVFADEPNVPAELMRMDNVVLAPHMGTSTREVREGRSEKLLHDVRAHFAGKPLHYAVL
ncbi:MAG TPA: 2-hydroxyacid dehydrogenase [Burkholderiales bacterium]|nr:2-hydroxyacid dehydrogenase [Burkholderiales bacterium]